MTFKATRTILLAKYIMFRSVSVKTFEERVFPPFASNENRRHSCSFGTPRYCLIYFLNATVRNQLDLPFFFLKKANILAAICFFLFFFFSLSFSPSLCSDDADFEENAEEMANFFLQRRYPENTVKKALHQVRPIPRQKKLQPNRPPKRYRL